MRNLEVTIQINMKMKLPFLLFAILLAGLWGCNESDTPEMVQGLRPIYGTPDELAKLIRSDQPLTLKQVGKIYTRGNLLFINELREPIILWEDDAYDAIGEWTNADVDARLKAIYDIA